MAQRRALVSVSDKTGVVDFCRRLVAMDFEVVSTGGTLRTLRDGGVPAVQVSEVTGVPEILGGRVKTLHPLIFGGILARRANASDLDTLAEFGMQAIDVVAVNLYPFARTVADPRATDEEIIEQIDIGGPSLVRAAAKNHGDVYVVVDPADYSGVLDALASGRSADYGELRRRLAGKVFEHTAQYDRMIGEYFARGRQIPDGTSQSSAAPTASWPQSLGLNFPLRQVLRYGENPHQGAAFYADPHASAPSMAHCRQLQGKELSYNNYLDGETALEMIREMTRPSCVILKHLNPCGAAWAENALDAYRLALQCDPTSAFGGIVGLNRPVDGALAEELSKIFLEVVIAPSFSSDAVAMLARKKNLRLLESGDLTPRPRQWSMKSISGGMLVQDADLEVGSRDQIQVVTKAKPNEEDWAALTFAWSVVKWVKSNAIVYTDKQRTVGVGAGQMSRIDAANFGLQKAGGKVPGGYLASDAFFPFRDVVDLAAGAGVRAIIQPGGSVRDDESVAAADEHGMIMVFTGMRHFRH